MPHLVPACGPSEHPIVKYIDISAHDIFLPGELFGDGSCIFPHICFLLALVLRRFNVIPVRSRRSHLWGFPQVSSTNVFCWGKGGLRSSSRCGECFRLRRDRQIPVHEMQGPSATALPCRVLGSSSMVDRRTWIIVSSVWLRLKPMGRMSTWSWVLWIRRVSLAAREGAKSTRQSPRADGALKEVYNSTMSLTSHVVETLADTVFLRHESFWESRQF